MRKFLLLSAFLLASHIATAVPAKRVTMNVQQSDGSELVLQLRGDENFHFYATPDGQPFRQDEKGDWVPDTRDVYALWTAKSRQRHQARVPLQQRVRRLAKATAETPRMVRGVKKGLLILVNFTDVKMKSTSTLDKWEQMMNGMDNPYGKNLGSVREYFHAQSYGLLDVEFDIVGPVTVAHNMAYYGADDGKEGEDVRPYEMVIEACRLVNDQVNFSDYDWDGDGVVENIYVTYAGYNQAAGGPANSIWPHQWSLSAALRNTKGLVLDDISIDTYACGSELDGNSGSTLIGIGTMCHEYSHCLGLPDFYDTETSINFGMGSWSLMDYGCYNGGGFCPCSYTSYERWYCGWLEPIELKAPTIVTDMPCIADTALAYVIYNEGNRNEYYLLENHQKRWWDKHAGGHGMLVLHVDYSGTAWYENTVNNVSSHQRMTLIPADGNLSTSMSTTTLAGDPWPGTRKKTALTDVSSPAATLYNPNVDGRKLMHKAIENIKEESGLISFDFMQDQVAVPVPTLIAGTSHTSSSFTAQWSAVEEAVTYNLRYTQILPGEEMVRRETLLEEDFAKLTTGTSDGTTDVGTKLNNYLSASGWSGTSVYEGTYGAKLGSSKGPGEIITPVIDVHSSQIEVELSVRDWIRSSGNPDGSTLTVTLITPLGEALSSQTITPVTDVVQHLIFTNVPPSFSISMSTPKLQKRVYLSYFSVSVEEQTLITGLTSTTHQVTDLTPGSIVTYAVQAVNARGKQSLWSESHTVTLGDNSAVQSISADHFSSREWFRLDGRRVSGTTLPRGIYLHEGRKIFIK